MCLNYLGMAHANLDGPDGLPWRESLALAPDARIDECAARGYTNLAESPYRFEQYDELAHCIREAGWCSQRSATFCGPQSATSRCTAACC